MTNKIGKRPFELWHLPNRIIKNPDYSQVKFQLDKNQNVVLDDSIGLTVSSGGTFDPSKGPPWLIQINPNYVRTMYVYTHELTELSLVITVMNILYGEMGNHGPFVPLWLPFHDLTVISLGIRPTNALDNEKILTITE